MNSVCKQTYVCLQVRARQEGLFTYAELHTCRLDFYVIDILNVALLAHSAYFLFILLAPCVINAHLNESPILIRGRFSTHV